MVAFVNPQESNERDELTYMNYAHNRRISPHVSAERWAKVYGPSSSDMEARYQVERVVDDLTRMVEEAEERAECEMCGGTGEYTLGRSDSDYGEIVKCECQCQHDWRGIDTGRMCAKCGLTERQV
jgi:hypothetical protein